MSEVAIRQSERVRVASKRSFEAASDDDVLAYVNDKAQRLPFVSYYFPAERILQHRCTRGNKQQFLVEWVDGSKPSWEPCGYVKPTIAQPYCDTLLRRFSFLPADVSDDLLAHLVQEEARDLLYGVQEILYNALHAPYKPGLPMTKSGTASIRMKPEVFLKFFASFLPAAYTAEQALLGVRFHVSFKELHSLCEEILPGWHVLRDGRGFMTEVVPQEPIRLFFRLAIKRDWDHDACPKCSVPHTLSAIVSGAAATKCVAVEAIKTGTPRLDMSFTHRRRNATKVYEAMHPELYA